jgi:hypothetical protein
MVLQFVQAVRAEPERENVGHCHGYEGDGNVANARRLGRGSQ